MRPPHSNAVSQGNFNRPQPGTMQQPRPPPGAMQHWQRPYSYSQVRIFGLASGV